MAEIDWIATTSITSARQIDQPSVAVKGEQGRAAGLPASILAQIRGHVRQRIFVMDDASGLGLPPLAFARQDEGADLDFYAPPRLVKHIDEAAVDALTVRYAEILKPGDRVLDLMSSWVSHLPGDIDLDVVGHGMNAHELAANPRFARWFVQDLNRVPGLPEPDGAFDAAFVCVGVQYLQRPLEVFLEVRRILRPGGVVIVSYSNRCFPTKAVAIWRSLDMQGQAALIGRYLDKAGFRETTTRLLADGRSGDPLVAVEAVA